MYVSRGGGTGPGIGRLGVGRWGVGGGVSLGEEGSVFGESIGGGDGRGVGGSVPWEWG